MPSIEEQFENLKHRKKYKKTRKNGIYSKDSRSQHYSDPEKRKAQRIYGSFQTFDSQFTFFPFYDSDNNSFIRLYRLHKQYKLERDKKEFSKERVVDINTFKDALCKMNYELMTALTHEGEKLEIGKDFIQPYLTENRAIKSQRIPIMYIWYLENPHKINSDEYKLHPPFKRYTGKLIAKHIKAKYKDLRTDLDFDKGLLSYRDISYHTYIKYKGNLRNSNKLQTIDLGYNMFDDY